ncbi:MAG: type II toxin-antitoxin system VapC family toxin [Candidatus Parabeggiatoa sp. nov. 1]|nr:MAG: type II toxin-antitoxin system VapC family toxin [Gammaproteobacteria bacterium]
MNNGIKAVLVTSSSLYHLDTNIVIAYLNGNQDIADKLKAHLLHIAISSLVLGELLYGARASQRQDENVEKIYQFLYIVQVVDFNQASAEQYSHIRVYLRKKGHPTGEVDALIAAIAIAHNAILVTDNVKHFQHIEELTVANWVVQLVSGFYGLKHLVGD